MDLPLENLVGTFTKELQELRNEAGLTQANVASATGLTQSQISNIERGIVNPRLDTVIRLAHFYKKSVRLV